MRHTWVATALALFLVPVGGVVGAQLEQTGMAVEQHTTFVEMVAHEGQDVPGFAAVAGLVTCEANDVLDNAVLWFNEQLLFMRGRRGPNTACLAEGSTTHVWATEEGAPDPRGNPSLAATGNVFSFTDPNGAAWRVVEYVYHEAWVHASTDATVEVLGHELGIETKDEVRLLPHYTWVVEMGTWMLDPTLNAHYNFVTVVDFDKLGDAHRGHTMHPDAEADPREGDSHPRPASAPGSASDDEGHTEQSDRGPDAQAHAPVHRHDTVQVHLWTGPSPEPGPGQAFEQGAKLDLKLVTPEDVVDTVRSRARTTGSNT